MPSRQPKHSLKKPETSAWNTAFRKAIRSALPVIAVFTIIVIITLKVVPGQVDDNVTTYALAVAGSALVVLIAQFLNTDSSSFSKGFRDEPVKDGFISGIEYRDLLKRIDSLASENIDLGILSSVVADDAKAKLSDYLSERLAREIIDDEKEQKIQGAFDRLSHMEAATSRYISSIQRNSIVNLMIGLVASATSITIVAALALSERSFHQIDAFLYYYVPKVTFAIVVQVFSFFFLKLYKSNLADAKYFQNELVNVLAKIRSVNIAYHMKKESILDAMLFDLSKTERNFQLGKRQAVSSIEKEEVQTQESNQLVGLAKAIIDKVPAGK